jgi:hypothetical protein
LQGLTPAGKQANSLPTLQVVDHRFAMEFDHALTKSWEAGTRLRDMVDEVVVTEIESVEAHEGEIGRSFELMRRVSRQVR